MKILLTFCLFSAAVFAQEQPAAESRFSTYYMQKATLFKLLPNDQGEIIFLGNSITDGCEWSELFRNPLIKNRGISGDVTYGVIARLNEVTESAPRQIYLMIGVNDLANGLTVDSVMTNYHKIVNTIRHDTPKTELFLESVLPVNPEFDRFKNHVNKNDSILILNRQIEALADMYECTYINLHEAFLNGKGSLDSKYTNDGLHLTGEGYMLWKKIIAPLLPPEEE